MPETVKVRGAVKIEGLPDKDCIEDGKSFIEWLTKHLVLEIPTDITNVVMSSSQPQDRNALWIRRSKSGSFIGIYVFTAGDTGGNWVQFFPAPSAVIWMFGDSRDVDPGYLLIASGHPDFSTSQVNQLQEQYIRSDDDTHYTYFATTFVGL